MLTHIFIKNYALIDELSVKFSNGFNIISGETGSGKSIIVSALSLLLGNRTGTSILREPNLKCIVEGRFRIEKHKFSSFFYDHDLDFEEETTLRREITYLGKSRAFINDTPVTLSILKAFTSNIIEINSQHQSITLKDVSYQISILDQFCNHDKLLLEYQDNYREYLDIEQKIKAFIDEGKVSSSEFDFLSFQLKELENAELKKEEKDFLEDELLLLNNTERISDVLEKGFNFLDKENGIVDLINLILRDLLGVSQQNKKIIEISERLEKSVIELKDISEEILYLKERLIAEPERLLFLNERLNLINSLLAKHRKTQVSELLDTTIYLEDRLRQYSHYDEELDKLRNKRLVKEQRINVLAERLSKNRKKTIPNIEKQITDILYNLGMPYATFRIRLIDKEKVGECGKDKVNFLFSANKGVKPECINMIISGGELSRLMLAIKYISTKIYNTDVLVFDEIDTGVSGEVANLMGEMMKKIGKKKQIITITHLPQIASKGTSHFKVYKKVVNGQANTLMKLLSEKERIDELAKLLSGKEVTEIAIKNAMELLNV